MKLRGGRVKKWLTSNQSEKSLPDLIGDVVIPRRAETRALFFRVLLLAHHAVTAPERAIERAIEKREVSELRKTMRLRRFGFYGARILKWTKYESAGTRKRREAQERAIRAASRTNVAA